MSARGHAAGHQHLHVHADSPVHRLAPEAKLVGLVAFVVVVALTPRRAVPALLLDGLVLAAVVRLARVPARVLLTRVLVAAPFLGVAAFVPIVAGGEQVRVAGISLSVEGLWAAWNITAKAVLGASASIVLAATTPVPDLLVGMGRLRVPSVLVAIVGFMFRSLDLLVDQLRRMRAAMAARGHDARWLWQARPIASSAGVLFVRSYERGERIHGAMRARGFAGSMPDLDGGRASRRALAVATVPAAIALGAVACWAALR